MALDPRMARRTSAMGQVGDPGAVMPNAIKVGPILIYTGGVEKPTPHY